MKSSSHGVYAMLISGKASILEHTLETRDALGISETIDFNIKADKNTELLFIEVPMHF